MIWRLKGRVEVYTDTRGFYYTGELLEDSFYLPRQEAEYDQHLQRVLAHGTEYFLLPIDDAYGEEFKFWQSLKPYCSAPLYCSDQTERGPHYVLLAAEQVREAVKKRSEIVGEASTKRR